MGTNGKVNRGIPDRTPVTPLFTYLREIDQMFHGDRYDILTYYLDNVHHISSI